MTVHFIGAGPGAPDLITVRGRDLIERCPVCLYAGSLVPPEILDWCPPDARRIDTAPLDLDGITAEFVRAQARGEDVARLHSGDLSIWSALGEQIRRLDGARHPLYRDPRGAGFRGGGGGVAPRIDRAGSGAVGGADPDLRPRLGDAGERRAGDVRGDAGDPRDPPLGPCDREGRRRTAAGIRRRLPGRGGVARLAGRISASSRARSARSLLSCAPRHWNGRR